VTDFDLKIAEWKTSPALFDFAVPAAERVEKYQSGEPRRVNTHNGNPAPGGASVDEAGKFKK